MRVLLWLQGKDLSYSEHTLDSCIDVLYIPGMFSIGKEGITDKVNVAKEMEITALYGKMIKYHKNDLQHITV